MSESWLREHDALNFASLRREYESGRTNPQEVVRALYQRMAAGAHPNVWITLLEKEQVLAAAREVMAAKERGAHLPLYGIPFAVKDNIDVAGVPTTAACPGFAYTPQRSAAVVEKLTAAGAIVIGKTNLDQFATGLTGVLSPYGVPRNAFNREYVSGGSSSGSAVAVAAGYVAFALGTDTAGSGRVPAAFNHLVGLKPTRGLFSTRGVVPACRSLDVVSVLTQNVADAQEVMNVMRGFDAGDPFSRREADATGESQAPWPAGSFRFGVPRAGQLDFSGDPAAGELFAQAIARLESLGGQRYEVDITPFVETGKLLYGGPWVAERLASVDDFHRDHADAFLLVTHAIMARGRTRSAVEAFKAMHQLRTLARQTESQWALMDMLLLPTATAIPRVEEVQADAAAASARLGVYTNFVNLLDLSALALPAGFGSNGLPFGITLIGPAFAEPKLLAVGQSFFPCATAGLSRAIPADAPAVALNSAPSLRTLICVVGAHLTGQPLNHQLTDLGGELVRRCKTAPIYRLFALAGTTPPKPGLARPVSGTGAAVEVEVWSLPEARVGAFLAKVPPPLCIGTITLDNGQLVKGFLCESHALAGAEDITAYGGWLNYLRRGVRDPN